ncbi:MAG: lipopolysaccharide heptosyltransferase II, partial [Candidatus Omnitrophota bacterium]
AAIRNIRRNFPESFLACVIPSRCYPVLKGNPYLDEVIIFDEKDRHRGVISKLSFIRLLKAKRFDTVFLLHRSLTRALICRLAGIKNRIGYYTPKRAFLLTKSIPQPKKDSLHRIDYYLNIIEQAGLKVEDRLTDFYTSLEDQKNAEELLNKQGIAKDDFVVVINPGGNWPPKRWPKDFWAELADKLISQLGAKVIISGAYQDISLAAQIEAGMHQKPVIAAGIFNIKQLGALIKLADLFISADSGPLHIANACGAKIIALFGPTSTSITGPYPFKNVTILQKDIGCKIPCYNLKCKDNRCMKAITPDEVVEQVRLIKVNLVTTEKLL